MKRSAYLHNIRFDRLKCLIIPSPTTRFRLIIDKWLHRASEGKTGTELFQLDNVGSQNHSSFRVEMSAFCKQYRVYTLRDAFQSKVKLEICRNRAE